MSTVVHVTLQNDLPTVASIDDLHALRGAVRDRTGRDYGLEGLRGEVTRATTRLLRELQRDFLRHGVARLTPLKTESLAGEAPTLHPEMAAHVVLELFGENLPAGLLFPPPEGRSKPAVSRPAVLVALLRALREEPYADDERIAGRLRSSFPHVDGARVASLRDRLGIPTAICRPSARAMLSEAVARLAPVAWLRRKLDATLRLGDLRDVAPPWPTWWRLEHEKPVVGPGEALVEVAGELVRVRTEDLERARATWEKHAELLERVDDATLREAFARLVANAAAPGVGEIAVVLRAVAVTGRWPEPLRSMREPLAAEEVTAMLAACPAEDWDEVLRVVTERKLAAKPAADATDVLIELLAHAVSRGDGGPS